MLYQVSDKFAFTDKLKVRTYHPLRHEVARSISTPRGWDASPSQVTPHNLLGFPNNLSVPIYTPGWREAL